MITKIGDIAEMLDQVEVPKGYHAELMRNPSLARAVYENPAVRAYYIQSKVHEAKITKLAYKDDLTGLGNDRFLREILPHEMKRADRNGPLTLKFMDVDSLKRVNDKQGHTAGSHLLQDIGRIMTTHSRGSDWFFRYGGDEFARLMPNTFLDQGVEAAYKLLQTPELQDLFGKHGVSMSSGLATYQDARPVEERRGSGTSTPEMFIEQADKAMYHAKAQKGNGRSNICVYKDGEIVLV